ncbi:tetratricopeptide repeat protein [Pedobacter sandarakinus]|uniref:tetratricopeptide repeat protein n=1 Tax=Pedobacter sandarakinus TaxID=353156 RepID=UPI002245521E|nr:tetratricopeptide repeat protein [Pedobacter sandarakinus]MCX2573951.1 tetratricopeptide repeat protein [Pedobacter sandarakinus]
MKLITLCCIILFTPFTIFAQRKIIDSLYRDLSIQKTDTGKAITLYNLSYYYLNFKPDSAMYLARSAYSISKRSKFLRGESWALGSMANAFHVLHNYPKAIEYYIEQLKIEEKRNIPENIGGIYLAMALVYNSEKETKKALGYAFKADSIAKLCKLPELALFAKLNIGDIYEKANQLGSAMIYAHNAYDLSILQKNDQITGVALNNLGNIYAKRLDFSKANGYYRKSLTYLQQSEDYNNLAECYLGMAKICRALQRPDSAIFYARESYHLASKNEFFAKALDASAFLAETYKASNNIDSAFAYQNTMLKLKDSIDSKERAKELQSITIAEELRQKEIAEAREKEVEERRQKLQLLTIGILIPIFFLFSIFLSRRKVSKKVIEFSGIISLLMFFEYLTLFIHPFVAEKSHHSPFIEIVVFVVIAALLTPTHHKVEHWLINKLSKIRDHHLQLRQQQIEDLEKDEKP